MNARAPANSNGMALPYDEAAEECLAGACLGSWASDAIEVASSLVRSEFFYTPACRHVFDTALGLHGRGEAVDPHTVKHELERLGLLAVVGGAERLIELQVRGGVPSALPTYARLLAELAEQRSLILAGAELQAAGRAGDRARADKALEHLQAERVGQGPGVSVARALVRGAAHRALVDGGSFIFDVAERPVPVWGDTAGIIAWSRGEYLLVTGPTGTGKSTLIQNVALAGLGLRDEVLGLPVEPIEGRVLYLALDRRDQIARSFRRMVGEADRPLLEERLKVWDHPLPVPVVRDPEIIGALAAEAGASMVVIDSLKDVAATLSDEETGQAIKDALTVACLDGVQVAALHHQRKKQAGGNKPKTLDDVYGSNWLTAGAGSVLLLWGEAGDALVEISHLKPPTPDLVGPWNVLHNHDIGLPTIEDQVDLLDVVRRSHGLTAEGAATALFRSDTPARNDVEKARRQLDRLVKRSLVNAQPGGRDAAGKQLPTRYFAISRRPS